MKNKDVNFDRDRERPFNEQDDKSLKMDKEVRKFLNAGGGSLPRPEVLRPHFPLWKYKGKVLALAIPTCFGSIKETRLSENFIKWHIDFWTTKHPFDALARKRFLKKLNSGKGIIKKADYIKEKQRLDITTQDDHVFHIWRYSDDCIDLKKYNHGEILSLRRKGKCHASARNFSLSVKTPNELVTGLVNGLCGQSKYLHSWNETRSGDLDLVFDYTFNAVMPKNEYYKLMGPEVLCRISNETVVADNEIIKEARKKGWQKDLGVKEYCVKRDEVMKEVQDSLKGLEKA